MFKALAIFLIFSNSLYADSIHSVLERNKISDPLCRDLNPGESRVVSKTTAQSLTGVIKKYTLRKEASGAHQIYINPEFRDGKGTNKNELNDKWKNKLKSCFKDYESSLRDALGRSIKIKVWNKDSDIPMPPKHKVKIVENDKQLDINNYTENADCGDLVHEALHLTGLVDEFAGYQFIVNPNPIVRVFKGVVPRTSFNQKPAFDCRSKTPHNSIMGNYDFGMDYTKPILKPAHINMMIYPGCKKQNETYIKCSKNTWRTSKENGGFLGCKKVPEICKTPYWADMNGSEHLEESVKADTVKVNEGDKIIPINFPVHNLNDQEGVSK